MQSLNFGLIVPTLNPGKYWDRWFEAYLKQTLRPGQLIVIDSSSDDGYPRPVNDAPELEIYRIPRHEFDHGGTRNYALTFLKGKEYAVFLTQDAILAQDNSLELLLEPFTRDKRISIVYGHQLPSKGASIQARMLRENNYPSTSQVQCIENIPEFGIRMAFNSNSFAAYQLKRLNEIGGFPQRIILGEDVWAAGKQVLSGMHVYYQSEAEVLHSHEYSLKQEFKRSFDIGVFHAREPWLLENFGTPTGEGGRLVLAELRERMSGSLLTVPLAFLRAFVKLSGYWLGRHESALMRSLKKRLSMNPGYWEASR